MLIYLRGFFIFHPIKCLSGLIPLLSDRSRRRSFTLALAGTLGVGNIYGVAIGIILGGEGCVFWLLVSSVFALVIKYSECLMAASVTDRHGLGMMGVLPATFKRAGRPLSKIYAVLMLLLALLMGSFIQADSLISSAVYLIPVGRIVIAISLLLLVVSVVIGGGEKIKASTEIMIPIVTLVYILLCLFVIGKNISGLGLLIPKIIRSAFAPKPMIFGILPVINITAFSEGFARGILSNEAGVGTSSVAESEERSDPVASGLFGMCEIVFDTLLLCMLTAFMILLTVENPIAYASPMELVFDAVRIGAGNFALPILLFSIFIFAYSTIICWYYYGCECVAYLGLSRYKSLFLFFFLLFIIFAAFVDTYLAVSLNDYVLLLMSLPTAAAIVNNRKIIKERTFESDIFKKKVGK